MVAINPTCDKLTGCPTIWSEDTIIRLVKMRFMQFLVMIIQNNMISQALSISSNAFYPMVHVRF